MYKRNKRVNATFSPEIRIAIGDEFLPFLTIVNVEDEGSFFCQYEKLAFPEPSKLKGFSGNIGNHCVYNKITEEGLPEVVNEAILSYEKNSKYHLNPYSFINGYCIARGFNLFELGYLDY